MTTSQPKLKFVQSDEYAKHHQNPFGRAMEALKQEYHLDQAEILFIPSVGRYIYNKPPPNQSWIGIVHAEEEGPDSLFPDISKLCSKTYKQWMKKCVGLFALSKYQVNYMKQNLDMNIPIDSILYPFAEPTIHKESMVIHNLKSNQQVDLVLIGSCGRDFDYFFKCNIPKEFHKAMLLGDEAIVKTSQNAPESVKLLPKANNEEYEKIIHNSLVFLSIKYDGMANTLMIECIARNLPIVVPRFTANEEYIGKDYPLFYDQKSLDLTQVLNVENIKAAIEYLKIMNKDHLRLDYFCNSVRNSKVINSLR